VTYIEGDIVQHTWGYGQTNQQFYEVLKRTPKTVMLRELKQEFTSNGFMQGMCWPVLGQYCETPGSDREFRKRVFWGEDGEELHPQFGWMMIWDGEPQRWTGYY